MKKRKKKRGRKRRREKVVVIERTCSLCGAKFKCKYKEGDEEAKALAEAWEICPKCWKGESEYWEGGE